MLSRKHLVVLLTPVLLAACGGEGSTEPADAAESPQSTATEETPSTPAATETSATAPELNVVIEEDFSKKSVAFATGEAKNYSALIQDGALEMFVAGLGNDANSIYSPAKLPSPSSAVSIQADAEFQLAYGEGSGGYGLRCYAGEDYYLLYWSYTPGSEVKVSEAVIGRVQGNDFQVLANEPTPDGAYGRSGVLQLEAMCLTAEDGSVELSLTGGGKEAVSATDEAGLGPFDAVALYGEWKGEKIPGNDFNPVGGGFTFSFDNVVVATG
jgi:hypothetical protein